MAGSAEHIGQEGIADEAKGFAVETGKESFKHAASKTAMHHVKGRLPKRTSAQLNSQAADGVGEISSEAPELTGTGALDTGAAGVGMTEGESAALSFGENLFKFGIELKEATPVAVGLTLGTKLSGPDLDGNDTLDHPKAYDPSAPDAKADLDGDGDIDRDDAYVLDVMHHQGFEGQVTPGDGVGQIDVMAMDVNGDGKVGRPGDSPTITDDRAPRSAEDAKRKAAGHAYWSKSVTHDAVEGGPHAPGTDYLNRIRSETHLNASADFDGDGDIDVTDAAHEKKIHELGFEGQIDHDKNGRPILSAMNMDSDAASTSIQMEGGYAKYMQDIQSGHEGIGH